MLKWAELQFGDDPPASLGALGEKLSGPIADEVAALEAHLYGRGGAEWDGARLAGLLKSIDSVARTASEDGQDPLVPLYR